MRAYIASPKWIVAFLASLPIAAFAIYIAWLVVPEVVRVVVPAVVESVTTQ